MDNEKLTKILCLFAAFALGVLVMLVAVVLRLGGFQSFSYVTKFATVMGIAERNYVGEYEAEDFTDAALSAAVASLDDRWSYYMDAEAYKDYLDFTNNRYQGIGVSIVKDEETGGFRIEELSAGGPAELAGVRVGEIIMACDGVDVTDGTSAELKALIQADFGGEALLTLRAEDGSEREVAVSCEQVKTDPVSYEMLPDGIGYIRLENFETGLADSAIGAVDALLADGAAALVFDVRSNPGGSVKELCRLLDRLLPEGDLFIRTDKKGNEVVETSDAVCVELPMAVITNADSYSAAEFFAAALREYEAAVIAGEATTGKARSQVTYELSDGSAVHISRYTYLTPQRVDLAAAGGLVPDAECELGESVPYYSQAEKNAAEDSQLTAAIMALAS